MRLKLAVLAAFSVMLPILACTAEAVKPTTPAAAHDAGSGDGGGGIADAASPTTAGDTSGECNVLKNVAEVVTPAAKTGALPAGKGGALANGTYRLTAVDLYGGVDFPRVQATYELKNTLLANVSSFPDTGEISRDNLVVSVSGTSGTQTSACASSARSAFEYTATDTEIRFILESPTGAGGVVLTLTKS
jgi:hypothetical protein